MASEARSTRLFERDPALSSLFSYIENIRGIDFGLYRHATVVRKTALRLEKTGCSTYDQYLAYLTQHPDELDELIDELTIKVSNFFRNPVVFEVLHDIVLPEIAARFGYLKVWSLGCAKGEEPYSIAILVHDLMKKAGLKANLSLLGTDLCDGAVEKAAQGLYRESDLAETKKRYVDTYFRRVSPSPSSGTRSHAGLQNEAAFLKEDRYLLIDEIRAMTQFECADVLSALKSPHAPPEFNLILCRNLMIYMNKSLQQEVLSQIADLLPLGGYLVIGQSETILDSFNGVFSQPFPEIKIFRKVAPFSV